MGCLYQFRHRSLSGASLLIADTQQIFDWHTAVCRRTFRGQNVWETNYTYLVETFFINLWFCHTLNKCCGVEWGLRTGVVYSCVPNKGECWATKSAGRWTAGCSSRVTGSKEFGSVKKKCRWCSRHYAWVTAMMDVAKKRTRPYQWNGMCFCSYNCCLPAPKSRKWAKVWVWWSRRSRRQQSGEDRIAL